MYRSSSDRVIAERARWLTELAVAIDEAQRLAWRLGFVEGPNPEAMDLYERLEIARIEVESLRGSAWARYRDEIIPEWINLLPESLNRLNPAPEA